ncbi:MAG: peptidoglycan DD-metalloendopeptidase family protein [Mycobacterium leprae]
MAPMRTVAEEPVAQVGGAQSPAYMPIDRRLARKRANNTASGYQIAPYTVNGGDTLSEIAQTYNTDITAVLSINPDLDPDYIRPGDVIRLVPNLHGLVYRIEAGDTLDLIAKIYGVNLREIETANALRDDSILQVGDSLFLPGARAASPPSRGGYIRRSAAGAAGPTGTWHWPISGGLFTTEFSDHHAGLDIAVPTGTTAVAAAAGRVTFAGWDGGYGYCVIVDHGNGVQTRYAHASVLLVKAGQTVDAADPVIKVGSTGNSTGPHLHFEVLVNGVPDNPRHYLP